MCSMRRSFVLFKALKILKRLTVVKGTGLQYFCHQGPLTHNWCYWLHVIRMLAAFTYFCTKKKHYKMASSQMSRSAGVNRALKIFMQQNRYPVCGHIRLHIRPMSALVYLKEVNDMLEIARERNIYIIYP